jgi:hypothetical protein
MEWDCEGLGRVLLNGAITFSAPAGGRSCQMIRNQGHADGSHNFGTKTVLENLPPVGLGSGKQNAPHSMKATKNAKTLYWQNFIYVY